MANCWREIIFGKSAVSVERSDTESVKSGHILPVELIFSDAINEVDNSVVVVLSAILSLNLGVLSSDITSLVEKIFGLNVHSGKV